MTTRERVYLILAGALMGLALCYGVMLSLGWGAEIKRAAHSEPNARVSHRRKGVRVFPRSHRFKTVGRCLDHGKWIKGCR